MLIYFEKSVLKIGYICYIYVVMVTCYKTQSHRCSAHNYSRVDRNCDKFNLTAF